MSSDPNRIGSAKIALVLLLAGSPGAAIASEPGDYGPDVDVVGSDAFMARGEDVAGRVCASACHEWDVIFAGPRKLPTQWDFSVSDMLGRGAVATDAEARVVRQWLKYIWGSVWVNSAGAADLAAVLALPQDQAEAIVAYRDEHGKFADLDSLKAVPGVDAARIDTEADAIVFD